ncbi:MAG TPA: D-alanyl-D-alanine carboxypeptidase family protein [Candidatus Acidoferrales bacterium]|nr:D-alanyl-D-alanine carboxypeptidase family protein [Candidatus Acidoferrales bacterium]
MVDFEGWWKVLSARSRAIKVRTAMPLTGAALLSMAIVLAAAPAHATAQSHRHKSSHSKKSAARRVNAPLYKGALLEDADSGRVLMAYNADMEWPPASMAKMMLLLVAQEQINQGRFRPEDSVRISERSAHTGGSRVGLKEGDVYPLRELMKAALVKSANDAAVAVAEKIGGSVEAMVRMMNERARELGMNHTEYQTVDGLPPRPAHDADRTNAYDLATVARAIIRETNLLMWSGQESTDFDNGVCMLRNTNHLIGHFDGCDGLKTGFTSMAGFNVTTTAKRGNMRLVAVILGAPSNQQRFAQAGKLMEWGFENFTSVAMLKAGAPLPVQVQVNSGPVIQPVAGSDLNVVVQKADAAACKLVYEVPPTINGPVKIGEPLGRVIVNNQGQVLTEVMAISPIGYAPATDQTGPGEAYNGSPPPAYNPNQENQ